MKKEIAAAALAIFGIYAALMISWYAFVDHALPYSARRGDVYGLGVGIGLMAWILWKAWNRSTGEPAKKARVEKPFVFWMRFVGIVAIAFAAIVASSFELFFA